MVKSNVVAGSNVFLCRTEKPSYDPEFVAQIQDFDLLEYINGRHQVDSKVPRLSEEQMSIVNRGKRCTFAPSDPCIGLVDGKIQLKCINIECPGIYDRPSFYGKSPWKGCNPGVTEEYVRDWIPDPETDRRYGKPDGQAKYYFVDMISDEEMSRYVSDPGNAGIDHATPPAPVYENNDVERGKVRFDPVSGRRMVVIGYEKPLYPDEDGIYPIWGLVDEVETEKRQIAIRKAKKIEKKEAKTVRRVLLEAPEKVIDPDFVHKTEYEKSVIEHVSDEVKLTELTADYVRPEPTIVLLDNPAELAFVSGTFLVSGINHSVKEGSDVVLALVDDYKKYSSYGHVMISSTTVKSGCKEENVQAWKELSQRLDITGLEVASRDFYEFKYDDHSRWTCRNMYGVTHVCVLEEDIKEVEKLPDGIYPVSIVDDRDTYMMCKKDSLSILGRLGKNFVDLINALIQSGEITSAPANIKGVSIKVANGKMEILGMGHLKFIEY